jgi:steroid delta-isomerase-like uncharacterized protein
VSPHPHKQLVARIVDVLFTAGRLEELPSLADPAVLGRPMGGRGPHEAMAVVTSLRRAFPDLAFTIDDLIGEDDRVAASWTMTGTHLGPFLTVAPTGRPVRVRGITVFVIRRRRWAAAWGSWDLPHVLAQIGAPVPGMGPAAADGEPGAAG